MTTDTSTDRSGKRFFKRVKISLPVVFVVNNGASHSVLGMLTQISSSGASLQSEYLLKDGANVYISSLPNAGVGIHNLPARIIRQIASSEDSKSWGVQFIDRDSHAYAINLLIKQQSELSLQSKFSLIKLVLMLMMFVLIPSTVAYGLIHSTRSYGRLFAGFIAFICIERVWEVYFTGREKKKMQSLGDWTLPTVTFYYFLMLELLTLEFYFLRQSDLNCYMSILGAASLIASFGMRWWGTKSLGDQWGIRVSDNVEKGGLRRAIITAGPYGHVRHPIYTGYFMELTGLALIPNCYLTAVFALLVNVPIQVIRSHIEERELLSIFGEQYAAYKARTPAFIPSFFGLSKGSQRRIKHVVDFPDRRKR